MCLNKARRSATLFTGVPGVGEFFSFVLAYFDSWTTIASTTSPSLLNWNETKFELGASSWRDRVYVHRSLTSYQIFHCATSMITLNQHCAHDGHLYSSPDPSRYKEIMKSYPKARYTMPTWSLEELVAVSQYVAVGGQIRSFRWCTSPCVLRWRNRWGGIDGCFRNESCSTGVSSALEQLTRCGATLTYTNPPSPSADWRGQYGKKIVYSFASDHVFRKLAEIYSDKLPAGAQSLLKSGTALKSLGGGTAGTLFENICLWLKPLNGKGINATFLADGNSVLSGANWETCIT